jgi:hypothetical protein
MEQPTIEIIFPKFEHESEFRMHLCLRECEVIKEQDEMRAWTHKKKFWNQDQLKTLKRSPA